VKKAAAVIGHFDFKGNNMIGAVVKSRNIFKAIVKQFGNQEVCSVDIYTWQKHTIKVLCSIILAFYRYKNIVLVISKTSPLLMRYLTVLKKIHKNHILYIVVGGDIAIHLKENQGRIQYMQFIDAFFVETPDCVEAMSLLGFSNVNLLLNYKHIKPVTIDDMEISTEKPFRFCTFSRVIAQKGISDAINAIHELNQEAGCQLCCLDIYGLIDSSYEKELNVLLESYGQSCKYCGVIPEEESVKTLKPYYCMLFPTKYKTEGIPGTIVDAFAAALPVICSEWPRSRYVVTNGKDSIVYSFNNYLSLLDAIKYAINNPDVILKLKSGSLDSFNKYQPEFAVLPLIQELCRGLT
jgi:glycosyltransferase involved in cell wall biosynthesis